MLSRIFTSVVVMVFMFITSIQVVLTALMLCVQRSQQAFILFAISFIAFVTISVVADELRR
jgi:hypothetical protein